MRDCHGSTFPVVVSWQTVQWGGAHGCLSTWLLNLPRVTVASLTSHHHSPVKRELPAPLRFDMQAPWTDSVIRSPLQIYGDTALFLRCEDTVRFHVFLSFTWQTSKILTHTESSCSKSRSRSSQLWSIPANCRNERHSIQTANKPKQTLFLVQMSLTANENES